MIPASAVALLSRSAQEIVRGALDEAVRRS
jgi:hypothetical protein